jgi:hypothetical protein
MAEQIPNGDAPISADVEMKEESVAEVWQTSICSQHSA